VCRRIQLNSNFLYFDFNSGCFFVGFAEIREDGDSGTGGGNPILLRRVVVNETNGSTGTNGMIPDFPMMDPVVQDHSFQQQLLQVRNPCAFTTLDLFGFLHRSCGNWRCGSLRATGLILRPLGVMSIIIVPKIN